ncbi:MAG: hypothetical protein U9Q81_24970 [Pseudomonadota bacterium]|nr:hypothetical protein [Pseudomonadota bacterium]
MTSSTKNLKNQLSSAALAGALALSALPNGANAGGPYQVFTIDPCRALDTRSGGEGFGRMSPDTSMDILVADTFNQQQGGLETCGIPFPEAKGIYANVVAVGPSGSGANFLTLYPFDTMPPLVSSINYAPDTAALANGIFVPICDEPPAPGTECDFDLVIFNGPSASTDVILDITGYVAEPPPI